MQRYKLTIAYDGTAYCGWQVQAHPRKSSIQALLQKALETVLRHRIALAGSGRTDAGVHAHGQTAHFDSSATFEISRLRLSLNALLPSDIRVVKIEAVSSTFHARYSALSKIYQYHLHLHPVIEPFVRLYRHHVRESFDLSRVQQALPHFLGTHDFTSFSNEAQRSCASYDPIRTLWRLDLIEQKGGLCLEFEADGFLYKMVRNIVGTLLDIAAGRIEPAAVPAILAAKDRRRAGTTATAQGLTLARVIYGPVKTVLSDLIP